MFLSIDGKVIQVNAQARAVVDYTRIADSVLPIHVCIITNNMLVSQTLTKYLKRSARIRIIESNALSERTPAPCVAVIDLNSLPAKSGFIPNSGIRTILLGDTVGEQLCRFLSLGVNGFVRYCECERKLRKAVQAVASGKLYVTRSVLEKFVAYTRRSSPQTSRGLLTPRQRQVLELAGNRYTNKEIGSQLDISENTVKFHLAKVYSKLRVNDRHAAANQTVILPSVPAEALVSANSNTAHVRPMRVVVRAVESRVGDLMRRSAGGHLMKA